MFDNSLLFILAFVVFAFLIGLATFAIIEATHKTKKTRHTIVGDCNQTRWGCCPDQITPKYDIEGSNCIPILSKPSQDSLSKMLSPSPQTQSD